MTATVLPLHALRGASLTAFREVQAIVERARIHPRIVLSHCDYCAGKGRSLIRHGGRVIESACTNCAGSGTVTGEA